jgi:hypothetical protein
MMHFVEQIIDCQPYRLLLKFTSGEVRWVDLEPTLKAKATSPESSYRRLLDRVVLGQAQLDREARTIYWEGLARLVSADGAEEPAPLDFCPDTLYKMSIPVTPNEVQNVAPQ